MENWYTIQEFSQLHGMDLEPRTRIELGENALKIELDLRKPIEKKWKWEKGAFKRKCGDRKKGVRVWPESILQEIFYGCFPSPLTK